MQNAGMQNAEFALDRGIWVLNLGMHRMKKSTLFPQNVVWKGRCSAPPFFTPKYLLQMTVTSKRKALTNMKFREAVREDVPKILDFIRGLAAYEKMEDEVTATEELLGTWLFDKHAANVIFALNDEGKEVGFALYFYNFSTFLGKAGVYLEDLFVLPEERGKGYGTGLIRKLDDIAVENGCGRLEWSCLDWNTPSIEFYKSLGAVAMDEWTVYRVTPGHLNTK